MYICKKKEVFTKKTVRKKTFFFGSLGKNK